MVRKEEDKQVLGREGGLISYDEPMIAAGDVMLLHQLHLDPAFACFQSWDGVGHLGDDEPAPLTNLTRQARARISGAAWWQALSDAFPKARW